MNIPNFAPIYKVILVGDSGVGKTCLLSMYIKGECTSTIPTIAVEFCTKEIQLENGFNIKVQLWDTAGQERFKSLAMNYYRKAFGILLLFDVTKRSSFDSCINYLEEVRRNSDKNCVIYLVGNKVDLIKERQITYSEAQLFANKQNIKYIETSAVTNQKVVEVFKELLNDIYHKRKFDDDKNNFIKGTIPIEMKNNVIRKEESKNSICC